jgi:hypothetical protein
VQISVDVVKARMDRSYSPRMAPESKKTGSLDGGRDMSVLDTVKFFHIGGHYKVEIIEKDGILHAQSYALRPDKTTGQKCWENIGVKPLSSTDVCRAVLEAEGLLRTSWVH